MKAKFEVKNLSEDIKDTGQQLEGMIETFIGKDSLEEKIINLNYKLN